VPNFLLLLIMATPLKSFGSFQIIGLHNIQKAVDVSIAFSDISCQTFSIWGQINQRDQPVVLSKDTVINNEFMHQLIVFARRMTMLIS